MLREASGLAGLGLGFDLRGLPQVAAGGTLRGMRHAGHARGQQGQEQQELAAAHATDHTRARGHLDVAYTPPIAAGTVP